jgi:hypothetical protein
MAETKTTTPATTGGYDDEARNNWHRYLYIKDRGHIEYMAQARRCEGMYLGGGLSSGPTKDKAILTRRTPPVLRVQRGHAQRRTARSATRSTTAWTSRSSRAVATVTC